MWDLSRRSLMRGVGVGALSSTLLVLPVVEAAAQAPEALPGAASTVPPRSHFTPGRGLDFTAAGPAGRFRLKLTEILDVLPAVAQHRELNYNLIFRAYGTADPPSGLYQLSRTGFGAASLYLSPVGQSVPQQLQALVYRSV